MSASIQPQNPFFCFWQTIHYPIVWFDSQNKVATVTIAQRGESVEDEKEKKLNIPPQSLFLADNNDSPRSFRFSFISTKV